MRWRSLGVRRTRPRLRRGRRAGGERGADLNSSAGGRLSPPSTQWARVPRAAPAHTSETPLTHSETKQKHVTTTKSDLSSSAKRRAGLEAMESHLPARRITTPRPQSASATSRLSTRRTARKNAPAAYRRRSPTNAPEARGVLDASKASPRRRLTMRLRHRGNPRNEMPRHNTPPNTSC